ncbi:MAG: hypothetical protein EAY75_03070 [Bacteroidetes bacterium]|nr:MAG: hypothetical protein EAY75_03070 [Bacteroidota bacterium]
MALTACQKQADTETTATPEEVELSTLSTQDDAEADLVYNEVYEIALGTEETGIGEMEPDGFDIITDVNLRCYKRTVDPRAPGVFPKTVIHDFGTGCLGRDGKFRKGKIITRYSQPLVVPGAEATTTFDGFYVNDTKVQGRHTIKNNSTASNRIFTRAVIEGMLSRPNGNYIKWSGTHTNTQVEGMGTPLFPRDDVFSITGGARGQNKRGDTTTTWSRTIIEPLTKAFTCRWFSKGTVNITRNQIAAILNFGNGTCDNDATITINRRTVPIKLR